MYWIKVFEVGFMVGCDDIFDGEWMIKWFVYRYWIYSFYIYGIYCIYGIYSIVRRWCKKVWCF